MLYERDLIQNGHERLQRLILQLIPIRSEAEELRILGDQYLIEVTDEELNKAKVFGVKVDYATFQQPTLIDVIKHACN